MGGENIREHPSRIGSRSQKSGYSCQWVGYGWWLWGLTDHPVLSLSLALTSLHPNYWPIISSRRLGVPPGMVSRWAQWFLSSMRAGTWSITELLWSWAWHNALWNRCSWMSNEVGPQTPQRALVQWFWIFGIFCLFLLSAKALKLESPEEFGKNAYSQASNLRFWFIWFRWFLKTFLPECSIQPEKCT